MATHLVVDTKETTSNPIGVTVNMYLLCSIFNCGLCITFSIPGSAVKLIATFYDLELKQQTKTEDKPGQA